MTIFFKQHIKRRRRGFSLTEVAIAMAVISVSLVALLGLTATTLQTGKESAAETTLTTAAHEALDVLRAHTFATLPYSEPSPAKDVAQTPTTPTVLPTIYVAADGQWLSPERAKWPLNPEGSVAPPDDAVFKCVATIEPEASTLTPKALSNTDSETSVNLLRVQLALSPIVAPASAKPTVLIHATIPRQ
jgi:prepilin-type N-terminal cleavage/methylation domain-containing protein